MENKEEERERSTSGFFTMATEESIKKKHTKINLTDPAKKTTPS